MLGRRPITPCLQASTAEYTTYIPSPYRLYLDRHPVAALGSDDSVVTVIVDIVVVDCQEVAVVVGVEAVTRVVVYLVSPPVSLLVAVAVDPEMVVVYIRIVDVAVDVHIFEHILVSLVGAEPTDLVSKVMGSITDRPQVEKRIYCKCTQRFIHGLA